MKFDYRNIRDEDYFRELAKNKENNIANVKATQSGKGTDGGRDILLEFEFSDDIVTFQRKWVVQCKFREDNISPSHINQIDMGKRKKRHSGQTREINQFNFDSS